MSDAIVKRFTRIERNYEPRIEDLEEQVKTLESFNLDHQISRLTTIESKTINFVAEKEHLERQYEELTKKAENISD